MNLIEVGICVRRCESAEELLDLLRPSNPFWGSSKRTLDDWAFRGQADSEWRLIPAALRTGLRVGGPGTVFVSRGDPDCVEQLNAECRGLRAFVDLADDIGLTIPGDLAALWLDGPNAEPIGSVVGIDDWPPPGLLEALAIAQHHGVRTRLLDFTFDPRIAAYFAAADAMEGDSNNHDLAVWAINLALIRRACPCRYSRIRIVRVRRSANVYLKAQKGFFVYDGDRKGEPLEVAIQEAVVQEYDPTKEPPPVVKIDAPTHVAEEALNLLRLERVDRLHLEPSFATVARELRDAVDKAAEATR